ncbi:hypothetical protein GPECTOR_45g165 [Gonium pectorale]|uniref:DUF676 domain-containing protein n=1 Tax=Gonium pectorale TaxID=33097 RepID=A0A150G9Q6_GONPE|nr:hypothetical protein GPECTOR_45g165 [Gonium pectorale]|eukprot:KXZ46295.1 hypothetical protein GPECTOR_45g165 [Gonium pectorale]
MRGEGDWWWQRPSEAHDGSSGAHLFVCQHGLWGSPSDVSFLETFLQHNGWLTLNAQSNSARGTFDGADVCGDRLAAEVVAHVRRLNEAGVRLSRISFAAYSFGGLIVRYAVGKLHAVGFFTAAGLERVNFLTIASPHLGCWEHPSSMTHLAYNSILPWTLSRTGRQLLLADRWLEPEGLPLLAAMARPDLAFHAGLAAFRKRILLADIRMDRTVPYNTAAIVAVNPYMPQLARVPPAAPAGADGGGGAAAACHTCSACGCAPGAAEDEAAMGEAGGVGGAAGDGEDGVADGDSDGPGGGWLRKLGFGSVLDLGLGVIAALATGSSYYHDQNLPYGTGGGAAGGAVYGVPSLSLAAPRAAGTGDGGEAQPWDRWRLGLFISLLPVLLSLWLCMVAWLAGIWIHHYAVLLTVRPDRSWNVRLPSASRRSSSASGSVSAAGEVAAAAGEEEPLPIAATAAATSGPAAAHVGAAGGGLDGSDGDAVDGDGGDASSELRMRIRQAEAPGCVEVAEVVWAGFWPQRPPRPTPPAVAAASPAVPGHSAATYDTPAVVAAPAGKASAAAAEGAGDAAAMAAAASGAAAIGSAVAPAGQPAAQPNAEPSTGQSTGPASIGCQGHEAVAFAALAAVEVCQDADKAGDGAGGQDAVRRLVSSAFGAVRRRAEQQQQQQQQAQAQQELEARPDVGAAQQGSGEGGGAGGEWRALVTTEEAAAEKEDIKAAEVESEDPVGSVVRAAFRRVVAAAVESEATPLCGASSSPSLEAAEAAEAAAPPPSSACGASVPTDPESEAVRALVAAIFASVRGRCRRQPEGPCMPLGETPPPPAAEGLAATNTTTAAAAREGEHEEAGGDQKRLQASVRATVQSVFANVLRRQGVDMGAGGGGCGTGGTGVAGGKGSESCCNRGDWRGDPAGAPALASGSQITAAAAPRPEPSAPVAVAELAASEPSSAAASAAAVAGPGAAAAEARSCPPDTGKLLADMIEQLNTLEWQKASDGGAGG